MGVGTNCTADSVENAELAAQNGADALLAVTPYYNKGTQAGLLAHYTAIADASSLPLVLYNVPSRTGVDLLPETVRALGPPSAYWQASRKPAAASAGQRSCWAGAVYRFGAATTTRRPRSWRSAAAA